MEANLQTKTRPSLLAGMNYHSWPIKGIQWSEVRKVLVTAYQAAFEGTDAKGNFIYKLPSGKRLQAGNNRRDDVAYKSALSDFIHKLEDADVSVPMFLARLNLKSGITWNGRIPAEILVLQNTVSNKTRSARANQMLDKLETDTNKLPNLKLPEPNSVKVQSVNTESLEQAHKFKRIYDPKDLNQPVAVEYRGRRIPLIPSKRQKGELRLMMSESPATDLETSPYNTGEHKLELTLNEAISIILNLDLKTEEGILSLQRASTLIKDPLMVLGAEFSNRMQGHFDMVKSVPVKAHIRTNSRRGKGVAGGGGYTNLQAGDVITRRITTVMVTEKGFSMLQEYILNTPEIKKYLVEVPIPAQVTKPEPAFSSPEPQEASSNDIPATPVAPTPVEAPQEASEPVTVAERAAQDWQEDPQEDPQVLQAERDFQEDTLRERWVELERREVKLQQREQELKIAEAGSSIQDEIVEAALVIAMYHKILPETSGDRIRVGATLKKVAAKLKTQE